MKKVAFTLCCNNYLAQARTLSSSIRATNPDWGFVTVLVDRRVSGVDYQNEGLQLVDIEATGGSWFSDMACRYNTIELCTALKPFVFRYLFASIPEAETIVYFDPDVLVLGSLDPILEETAAASVALTPHVLTPTPLDDRQPQENLFLNHGVYNLGFLLMRRSSRSEQLLAWWSERMKASCLIDLKEGLFVDQLWFNLAPIYFEFVVTLRNPGLNMAYWNLHERWLSSGGNNNFLVNDRHPLVFFHFSSFSPLEPDQISYRGLTRFTFKDRPDLKALFARYAEKLLDAGFVELRAVQPYFEAERIAAIQKRHAKGWLGLKHRALDALRGAIPVEVRRKCFAFLSEHGG